MSSSGETSPLATTPTAAAPASSNQTPKFGTLIPNRVFVGGIPSNTQEHELKAFFTQFGAVKDCKIIVDRSGASKGSYGFVTFETHEDADKIIKHEGENLMFNGRKLNIGPAIRKQQTYPRMDLTPGAIYFSNGIPYTYQNGMAVFHSDFPHLPAQPQPAATYPGLTVQPQHSYIPYVQTSPPAAATAASFAGAAASPFRWTPQSPGAAAMASPPYHLYQTTIGQATGLPEMAPIYQPHYLTATEVSELEANAAAAAAAEGSMAMELNMYAEKLLPTAAAVPAPFAVVSSAACLSTQPASTAITSTTSTAVPKPSPIVYGKRPGSSLVSPPCKMMSTPRCSVMYSPQLTPTPPYYKYDRSIAGYSFQANAALVKGRPIVAASSDLSPPSSNTLISALNTVHPMIATANLIPLTPPATPNVK